MFNFSGSDGAFTRWPEGSTVIPGNLLRLNCSISSADPVLWTFTAESATVSTDMTLAGDLLSPFTEYFYIVPSSKYDLVAQTSNANESYCGTYTCVDYRTTGDRKTATVASKCTIMHIMM